MARLTALSSPLTVWEEASLIFSLQGERSLSGPLPTQQDCHCQLGILFDSKDTLSEGFNRFANFKLVENNPCYNVYFLFLTTPTGAEAKTAWMQTQRRIANSICQNQAASVSFSCDSALSHTC